MKNWLHALLHHRAGAATAGAAETVDVRLHDADDQQLAQRSQAMHAELESRAEGPISPPGDLGLDSTEQRRARRAYGRVLTRKRR